MADVKITALPAAGALARTDIFPVVVDPGGTPVTEKSTLDLLSDSIPASATEAGTVTTGAQTMAGAKTFSTSVETPNLLVSTAAWRIFDDTGGSIWASTGPVLQPNTDAVQVGFIAFNNTNTTAAVALADAISLTLTNSLCTLNQSQPLRFGAGASLAEIGKVGAADSRVYISSGLVNGAVFDTDNGGLILSQDLDGVLSGKDAASPKALTVRGGNSSGANDGANLTLSGGTSASGDQGAVIVISGPVPATASSPGVAGTVAFDATHFYRCIATDTWVRVAMATW